MFERFTEQSRRVVVLAQEEARMLDHNYIGTEHILLGLIHEGDGVAARAIVTTGITLEAVRAQVTAMIGRGRGTPSGHIPFTPRAKKILELSLREALELKSSYIDTEHILLGLIHEGQGVGAQILTRLGPPLPQLRRQLIDLATAEPSDQGTSGDEPDTPPGPTASASHWPSGWPPLFERGRGIRVRAEAFGEFREVLASIDRRLAAIERHLGLAPEPGQTPAAETVREDPPADAG